MNTLLIADSEASIYADQIMARNFPDLTIYSADSPDSAEPYIASANIILGSPDLAVQLLPKAEKLCWLQSTFAGIESFCTDDLPKNYILTGVKNVFGPLMSEYVFLHILAAERRLRQTYNQQSNKKWTPLPYRGLDCLTIGIAGLGSIGRHIATTASHFGMRVLGLKRTVEQIVNVEQVYAPAEKNLFLSQLDYLILTLPATTETHHFLQFGDMEVMKDSAIIVSVGRGDNINEDDLVRALQNKIIGGAVLDVFKQEPLPVDHLLWDLPNVYITPHTSAVSFPAHIASLFCENYCRFVDGQELKYIVDFQKGY